MNLNSIEFQNAQSILIKLVQALSPLTVQTVPASIFLNRRFFAPHLPEPKQPKLNKESICVLSKLHQVKEEVDGYVGESKEGKEAPQKKHQTLFLSESLTKLVDQLPISVQAKKLMNDVQEAISKLSSSKVLQKPNPSQCKKTLAKIKPELDRIVRMLSDENESESSRISDLSSKPPILKGQNVIQESRKSPERETELHVNQSASKKGSVSTKEGEGKEEVSQPTQKAFQAVKGEGVTILTLMDAKPIDQKVTSITAAPFSSSSKAIIHPKKRKKRNSSWLREEKEDDKERS